MARAVESSILIYTISPDDGVPICLRDWIRACVIPLLFSTCLLRPKKTLLKYSQEMVSHLILQGVSGPSYWSFNRSIGVLGFLSSVKCLVLQGYISSTGVCYKTIKPIANDNVNKANHNNI